MSVCINYVSFCWYQHIVIRLEYTLTLLFCYSDEELPDYIMVMVANKKTSQQMADDLSLFLGNNTIKFTVWYAVLKVSREENACTEDYLFPSTDVVKVISMAVLL